MPPHGTLAFIHNSIFLGIGAASQINACIWHLNGRCVDRHQCPLAHMRSERSTTYGCPSGQICCNNEAKRCGPNREYFCRKDCECGTRVSSFEKYSDSTYDCTKNLICCKIDLMTL